MTQHFHSGYTSKKKKRKKERKTLTRKTTLTPGLIAALFTNAKIGKLCKHSSTKKVFIYIYIHTHTHTHTHIQNEILLSHTKEQNFAICSNMNELGGHYAKSQAEKHCMISLTCGI